MDSLSLGLNTVLNFVCNNDCKRKSDTAGPKHLVEIKHASSPADFQDAGGQMNTHHEIRIKNANRLIKDKIDTFLISETKLDSPFPSGQFVIKVTLHLSD